MTWLVWTTWTPMSAGSKRPLNLITHSLTWIFLNEMLQMWLFIIVVFQNQYGWVVAIIVMAVEWFYPGNDHIDGLMQKRHMSRASAMELHLFCIKPTINIFFLDKWGESWRTRIKIKSIICHCFIGEFLHVLCQVAIYISNSTILILLNNHIKWYCCEWMDPTTTKKLVGR